MLVVNEAYYLVRDVGEMRKHTCERAVEVGRYIVTTGATHKQTAGKFKVSRSTITRDVSYRLPLIDKGLARQANKVAEANCTWKKRRDKLGN